MSVDIWIIVLVALAFLFDFLNGFHDSANVVATMISSRALSGKRALTLAAICEFVGPFLFGVAVAKTIGHGVVLPEAITVKVIITALLSACVWNVATWYFGIPSSSSHALIGGLIGAVFISAGKESLQSAGLIKIFIALFTSPIIGLAMGYLVISILKRLLKNAKPSAAYGLKLGQIPAAMSLALSHGANDAQKTMGIITLGLVVQGYQSSFYVPFWVIALSSFAIALGTAFGGWRIIRTLGSKFYKVKPIHSFSSQVASAMVILTASFLGGPVSTTQVVSMSIMGAGAGDRMSKVRWLILKDIGIAWLVTIPFTAVLSMLIYLLIKLI